MAWERWIRLLLCFFFALAAPSLLLAEVYMISSPSQYYAPASHAEFFEDKQKTLTIREVVTAPVLNRFQKVKTPSLDFRQSKAAYWIKFDFLNRMDSPAELLFEIDAIIHRVSFHIQSRNRLSSSSSGMDLPFGSREFKHRSYIFPTTLQPNQPTRVFFRVESDGRLNIPIKLWTVEAFREKDRIDQLFWGGFFGIFLAMILYNVYLFATLKEPAYLYFVMIMLGMAVYFAIFKGFLQEIFHWYSFYWYSKGMSFCGILTAVFLILFANEYLMLSQKAPKTYKLTRVLLVLLVFNAAGNWFLDIPATAWVTQAIAFGVITLVFVVAVIIYRQGFKPAGMFLLAWVLPFFGLCIFFLKNFGVFPSMFITDYGFQFGLISGIILFPFGLADRISLLQKEREDAQREALETMERTDRLKDEFLANTSHELKTPLHGIIGISESLVDSLTEQAPPHIRKNLNLISTSGRRLARLVDDILDFSKLKHDELRIRLQPVSLKELVDIVTGMSKTLLKSKDLRLVNGVEKDLPAVLADESRLQQILFNLVGNAIKYTDSGSIDISAGIIGDKMEVRVTDTGIGIATDKLESIFNSFEQIESSLSDYHGGVGLGLPISRKLIELQNGTLKVQSEPGLGSTFILTIPVARETVSESSEPAPLVGYESIDTTESNVDAEATEPVPDQSRSQESYTVLSVDDDPVNQQVIDNYLSSADYKVISARDGEDALCKLDQFGKPDLILLDIMMPRLSGIEFCQRVRENYPAHLLPVIFLSAKNQISDIVDGFQVGGNDYIQKPFNKSELLVRIENCLYLSKAAEKLESLRRLGDESNLTKSQEQLLLVALHYLSENIMSSSAFLFHENKLLHCTPDSSTSFLKKKIELHRIKQTHLTDGQEIIAFYETDSEPWSAGDHPFLKRCLPGNYGVYYICIKGLEDYLLALVAGQKNPVNQKNDLEYIKHVILQTQRIKNKYAEIIADLSVLESVYRIRQRLNDTLFVKAEAPYCSVAYDASGSDIKLLRISIQNLDLIFGPTHLLKVHRSYLINPDKVNRVEKTGRDFAIFLQDKSGNEIQLPVSRSLQHLVEQFYSPPA